MTSRSDSHRAPSFLTRMLQGGSLSVIKLATGLVKIKLLSLFLGASGLGILSLALQFQTLSGIFVSLFLSTGVLNLTRPMLAKNDEVAAASVVGTASFVALINGAVFVLVFLLAQRQIPAILHLDASTDRWILWTLVASALVTGISTVFCEPLTMALNRFDLYVRANAISAVADVLFFTIAARYLGVRGAIAAILLSISTLVLAYLVGLLRLSPMRRLLRRLSFKKDYVRPLLSYSAVMIGTSIVLLGGAFAARSYITSYTGARTNGLLQVAVAFASYLQPFILNGVYGYLQPIAAEHGDIERSRTELRQVLRKSIRLASAGCACVVLGAPIVVPIAYSKDFVGSMGYIDIYFVGEFFYDCCLVYGVYLIAVGAKRPYLFGATLYGSILLAISLLQGPSLGAWAYVDGHIIGAFATVVCAAIYGARRGHFDTLLPSSVVAWGIVNAFVCGVAFATRELNFAFWLTRALGAGWVAWLMAPYARRVLASVATRWRALRA